MPAGASAKREREYKELKHKFKGEGRYKGREDDVASRIVNKQRSEYGETKAKKKKDRAGKSPDSGLPIRNYQHKTVGEVRSKLRHMDPKDIEKLERYEKKLRSSRDGTLIPQDGGVDGYGRFSVLGALITG